ncbi:MAG: haloacid dehalogenase type II, partial [Chloroflexales bacterium]|nr:haloacid dehalogenase type II [Chloroflexales bacterium]
MRPFTGVVFDAYGTLLDVSSVVAACEAVAPGQGAALSRLWRQRQLEYTWLRSLMGRHADFWQVTGEALAYACAALGCPADPASLAALRDAYLTLAPFAEVPAALARLAPRRQLILSNGTPAMLHAALDHAGLLPQLEAVLSVEMVGVFKPAPQVYALALAHLGCRPAEVLFVSANGWDVAGAAHAGLSTCWVNRGAAPPE